MADNDTNGSGADQGKEVQGPQFVLQRIYLKDCSFESPRSPQSFKNEWQPKINFDVKTRSTEVDENVFEVVLSLTVEAKLEDQVAFVVEVQQGGVFTCKDFEALALEQVLHTMCPNILYPYAREAVDNLVVKGSFPALMLAPINFELLYAQQKEQQQKQASDTPEAEQIN